jgi:hypothetical protein
MIEESDPIDFVAHCPICDANRNFRSQNDYYAGRDRLHAIDCPFPAKLTPFPSCATRERGMAATLFSLFHRSRIETLDIHEAAPIARGLTLWLKANAKNFVSSGYFPDKPFGEYVNQMRNENLENQTFEVACTRFC